MSDKFSVEDIKSRIYKDSNGISNYVDVSIEEMDWLVKQAEKVEKLEKEIQSIKDTYDDNSLSDEDVINELGFILGKE